MDRVHPLFMRFLVIFNVILLSKIRYPATPLVGFDIILSGQIRTFPVRAKIVLSVLYILTTSTEYTYVGV